MYTLLDEEVIKRIIIGCDRFVCIAEDQYYRERFKPRKPSQKQLAQLSVLWPSLTSEGPKEFRPFPHINSKVSGFEKISPPVVNRSLKTLVNVGYYRKVFDDPNYDEHSGQNRVYSETEYLSILKKLVLRLKPRAIIYSTLRLCHILERYLRICKYAELVRCKDIHVDKAVKVLRSKGPVSEREIDDYNKVYVEDQKLIKQKSIKDIFRVACLRAKNDLNDKHKSWHSDIDYTRFFIEGGIGIAVKS